MSVIDYSWDFSKDQFDFDLDFFNEKEQEDKLWQARTGLDLDSLCGTIETIIFMSDRPVNLQKIKNQIDPDLPLRVIHESIARLQREYECKHHGIRLMEVALGYQFRTKATYAKVIQNMFKVQSLQLSPTALEVLAMVAYKQPISRTSIESIRGVDSSHIVRALMDKRLVKMAGRSEEIGRPSLYVTTVEFLEIFNLNTINDLPSEIEIEELANANEVGQISDIRNIISVTDKKRFDMDELMELDELSSNIKNISADTLFTKSLKEMEKTRKTDEGVEKKSAFDILEEYVYKAQVIEQNKLAKDSEVLTSIMEAKTISLATLDSELHNKPQLDDEVAGEEDRLVGPLQGLEKLNFEELDSSCVKDIETRADDVLEKSNELIESLITDSESSLESELDNAFDQLLANNSQSPETPDENDSESEETRDEIDLSSFISSKITGAEAKNLEEDELTDALDKAFAQLTAEEPLEGSSLPELPSELLSSENDS